MNCGKYFGLIKLFQEDYPWVSFIWCFSHSLELVLKDVVKEVLEPINRSLCNLYYLYAKSSEKHRELKNLFSVLGGQFKMYSAGVHPEKATSMCWFDHRIHVMGCVFEKFGLYNQHLENFISTTANAKARATLEGKNAKLVNAKLLGIVLLCPCHWFFSSGRNKHHCCCWGSVKNTKQNYQRLLRKTQYRFSYYSC